MMIWFILCVQLKHLIGVDISETKSVKLFLKDLFITLYKIIIKISISEFILIIMYAYI